MPVNYSDGKIYCLKNGGFYYVGSTCQPLERRLAEHKRCTKRSGSCSSKHLFDLKTKVKIVLLEEYPCESRAELHHREAYWIRQLRKDGDFTVLNLTLPTRKDEDDTSARETAFWTKILMDRKLKGFKNDN